LALFSTVCLAHVKMYYDTVQMPIRNAATKSGDGTFSTDGNGCGGANTFGQNGFTTIVAGSMVNLHFNYGTGTNGDHADPGNMFWAAFINLDAGQKQSDMFTAANQLAGPVAAASGSTPTGYSLTIKIPNVNASQAVLSIYDQRHWGGCIDLQVISSLNAALTPTYALGWVPQNALAGYTITNCVSPNFVWINVTSDPNALASSAGQSYCCPAGATPCGGRCWMGDAPSLQSGGVDLFADGTLCAGNTICNGTLSQAYCSYTFKGAAASKCEPSCSLCDSLCQTSSDKGYANCACVGSDAVTQTLGLMAVVMSIVVSLL